jgi:hypothetical protein
MNEEKPWVCVDSREDIAPSPDYVIGNKSGLRLLKCAIDRALQDEDSRIEDPGSEIKGVMALEHDPRQAETRSQKVRGRILGSLVLVAVGSLVLLGLLKLWELLK